MSLVIMLYFTSSMLNMFWTLIHPSSGACDFFFESPCWSCVLVSMCVGVSVWLGRGGIRVAGFGLLHGYHPNPQPFCCECCVLSGRGLCNEVITCPEESYRLWCVVVCDLETLWMRRPWHTGGLLHPPKKIQYTKIPFHYVHNFSTKNCLHFTTWLLYTIHKTFIMCPL